MAATTSNPKTLLCTPRQMFTDAVREGRDVDAVVLLDMPYMAGILGDLAAIAIEHDRLLLAKTILSQMPEEDTDGKKAGVASLLYQRAKSTGAEAVLSALRAELKPFLQYLVAGKCVDAALFRRAWSDLDPAAIPAPPPLFPPKRPWYRF